MMKRTCRHIFAATMVMVMLFTVAIPVFAANVDTVVVPAGIARSPYRTGSFLLGGTSHNYSAGIAGDKDKGAYTSVTVMDDTVVGRRHNNLSVMFITTNAGNQPGTGGYTNITCAGYSKSGYVGYGPGMKYVKGYYSISGTIVIFGDTNHTISLGV